MELKRHSTTYMYSLTPKEQRDLLLFEEGIPHTKSLQAKLYAVSEEIKSVDYDGISGSAIFIEVRIALVNGTLNRYIINVIQDHLVLSRKGH